MILPYVSSGSSNGGAIMLQTLSHANITRCRFRVNHASRDGGAIYVATKTELRLCDSEFTRNRAKNGGSVAVYMAYSLIESCSFTSENASKQGGCFYLNFANVIVKESNLSECKSGSDGGSVFVFEHSTLRLETVMINNSHSIGARDAIYVTSESELFMTDSALTGSGSELSGRIWCKVASRMYLDSVSISHCPPTRLHGCVFTHRCTCTMNNITITNTDHAITGEDSTMNIYNTLALNDTLAFLSTKSSDVTLWNLNIRGARIKLFKSVAEFRHTMFMIQEGICPIEDEMKSNITFKSVYLPHTANMSQSESRIVCRLPETVVNGNTSGKTKVFEFI